MEGTDIQDNKADEFLATLVPEAKNWKQVEIRCMIQDILGNEMYAKHDSDKLGDRTIFYCITVPGENFWVRNCSTGLIDEFLTNDNNHNNGHNTNGDANHHQSPQKDQENPSNASEIEKNKRLSCSLVNRSFPIPGDGKNKSCLIKVYDMNIVEKLRVNDIVQLTGLVEPNEYEDDSQLMTNKHSPNNSTKSNENNNNNNKPLDPNIALIESDLNADFEPASHFPHHLVPRVHVRRLKKLRHINPLLPDLVTWDSIDITAIKLARAKLSTFLTQILGGDSLSAEYLILSLISGIHRRKDATTLGQLTVGLSGIKPEMKFLIEKLYEIISKITTHSHMIDMSVANLNNLQFTPVKDYDNNKMIAGTLQLPDGMYLLLNETALSEGQLNAQGTQNLRTLNHIIRWQRHNYDFKFQNVEIDTDLKVLVVSEGKSVLTIPYQVKLEHNDPETINSMRIACDSVNDFLNDELLNSFRYFITALRDVPNYEIPEEVQKSIEEDFVCWRSQAEANGKPLFSADDLSSYMTLARYLTLSRGETVLSRNTWEDTCKMELSRQERLSSN